MAQYGMTASDGAPSNSEQDDLYGETDNEEQEKSIDDEEREQMANTALVPLKVLKDSPDEEVKEGDEIVVKVGKIHGEECEISYAPKKGKEDGGGKDYMESADNELDSMSKE